MATSGDFCIVAVNNGKGALAEMPAFVVGKSVAPLAGLLTNGFPINFFDGDGFFHFLKRLLRKLPVAKPTLLGDS
jgi:hypothetical protein